MTERVGVLLAGQRPFMAAFISKGRGGGNVGLHPDWTYVDERAHRARVFWCALQDTDESNGAMVVVPGSHRTMRGLRGSGEFPSAVSEVEDALWASEVVTVPLRAGEALVWDAALLHGSWPNTTAEPRAAAAIAVVPATAPLVHFQVEPGAELAGYAVDEHWFVGEEYASRPAGYPTVEPWDGPLRPYASVDEVVPALQA
jgi:ectoine hydroxylase-related dioxygenase (phytanoyl-CoA dioxygenase family)